MKKIVKILLILIGFIPIICNAESEEVKWKWYTTVESNVHYEKDAKQSCEYFDENNYILGDYQYSLTEPYYFEGREITKENAVIKLDTGITNRLFINNFQIDNNYGQLYEIEIFDIYGNKINYEIDYSSFTEDEVKKINDGNIETFVETKDSSNIELVFYEPVLLKDLKIIVTYKQYDNIFKGLTFSNYLNTIIPTKSFNPDTTINTNECEEGFCKLIVRTPIEDTYYEKINVPTPVYKYRDKYYKCFTNEKIYVPGYYKELEGFIKDEEDYIKVKIEDPVKEDNKQTTPIYNNNNIKLPDITVNNTFPDVIKFEPYSLIEKEPINNTYNITVKEDENKNAEIISMINKLDKKTDETPKENEIIIYLLDMLKEKIQDTENKQISYNDIIPSNTANSIEKTKNDNSYLYLIILIILTLIVTIAYIVKKSRAK